MYHFHFFIQLQHSDYQVSLFEDKCFTVFQMLYEDPVTGVDIEKQTLTTNSGKLLKYGTLIIATGCTASR